MSYHHKNNHHHSLHHTRPLGVIKNHFFQLDNVQKAHERLHPKVQIPLAGLKHVHKHHEVMKDIAPDFNNQKITNPHTDSVLSEQTGNNPNRTGNTFFTKKRNEELILSAFAILGVSAFLLYIKR